MGPLLREALTGLVGAGNAASVALMSAQCRSAAAGGGARALTTTPAAIYFTASDTANVVGGSSTGSAQGWLLPGFALTALTPPSAQQIMALTLSFSDLSGFGSDPGATSAQVAAALALQAAAAVGCNGSSQVGRNATALQERLVLLNTAFQGVLAELGAPSLPLWQCGGGSFTAQVTSASGNVVTGAAGAQAGTSLSQSGAAGVAIAVLAAAGLLWWALAARRRRKRRHAAAAALHKAKGPPQGEGAEEEGVKEGALRISNNPFTRADSTVQLIAAANAAAGSKASAHPTMVVRPGRHGAQPLSSDLQPHGGAPAGYDGRQGSFFSFVKDNPLQRTGAESPQRPQSNGSADSPQRPNDAASPASEEVMEVGEGGGGGVITASAPASPTLHTPPPFPASTQPAAAPAISTPRASSPLSAALRWLGKHISPSTPLQLRPVTLRATEAAADILQPSQFVMYNNPMAQASTRRRNAWDGEEGGAGDEEAGAANALLQQSQQLPLQEPPSNANDAANSSVPSLLAPLPAGDASLPGSLDGDSTAVAFTGGLQKHRRGLLLQQSAATAASKQLQLQLRAAAMADSAAQETGVSSSAAAAAAAAEPLAAAGSTLGGAQQSSGAASRIVRPLRSSEGAAAAPASEAQAGFFSVSNPLRPSASVRGLNLSRLRPQ